MSISANIETLKCAAKNTPISMTYVIACSNNVGTKETSLSSTEKIWAVVVALLVERMLTTLEVCSSNPVLGKNLILHLSVNCIEKTKSRKRGRELPIF